MAKIHAQTLTHPHLMKLRENGTSDVLTVPAPLVRVLTFLKASPLLFEVTLRRDENGQVTLIFQKTEEPTK